MSILLSDLRLVETRSKPNREDNKRRKKKKKTNCLTRLKLSDQINSLLSCLLPDTSILQVSMSQ